MIGTMSGRRRLWIIPGLAVTLAYLLPVYWMLITSLKQPSAIFANPPSLIPLPPTFEAYQSTLLSDADLARGLMNSAIIAIGATVVTLVVAVPAAYALARLRIPFVSVFLMLFLVVQMVPAVNLALPLFSIFSQAGLVNTYAGLIIADCSLIIPLAVTIVRPYFLSVPNEVIEAAKTDGCTTFSAFARIAVPISLPGITTIAVISFLQAWGEFVFGLSLATDDSMQPATVVLSGVANQFGTKWNDVMAASAVIALPVLIVFIFLQRYIVAGLTEGATKT